jgi:hypothetical protein
VFLLKKQLVFGYRKQKPNQGCFSRKTKITLVELQKDGSYEIFRNKEKNHLSSHQFFCDHVCFVFYLGLTSLDPPPENGFP